MHKRTLRKIMTRIAVFGLLLSSITPLTAFAHSTGTVHDKAPSSQEAGRFQTGWVQDGSVWYYTGTDGTHQTGWQKIDGTWYYLAPSGAMMTGWQKIDGTWYYLAPSGAMMTGWQKLGNEWYFLYDSGAMAADTLLPDGCYVDGSGKWLPSAASSAYDKPAAGAASDQSASSTVSVRNQLADQVFQLVNQERAKEGLRSLKRDDTLDAVAGVRAQEIPIFMDQTHNRPDGSSFSTAFEENGYDNYRIIAENLASGFSTADSVMSGWMGSSGHRKNILNSKITEIGISINYADGVYYWVQEFGG